MGFFTFKGGIHPYEGKELTRDMPTKTLMPKGDMVFLMSQHMGEPAEVIVAKGDTVLVGQKIGQASGKISANIISSVSGKVKAIETRVSIAGKKSFAVVIENDQQYLPIQDFGQKRELGNLSKHNIREIIKEAGIVGLGGAAFPTHIKLTPPKDEEIEYIIINASECEPYLTSDYRLIMEDGHHIIEGVKVLLRLFEGAKVYIATEDNKVEAVRCLNDLAKNEDKIEVKVCKTKYPQGGERPLIYALTKRKISSKNLPHEVGCLVVNVATVHAISKAVLHSTPLIRRNVTVAGDGVVTPGNFNVPIGTEFNELIQEAGGFNGEVEKIICGGPMMGEALYTLDHSVTKNTSGIVAFTKDESATYATSNCIRCGRCVEVCPGRIIPQKLYEVSQKEEEEEFVKLHGMECCNCGSCVYVCPAKIRLSQSFREIKQRVKEKNLERGANVE